MSWKKKDWEFRFFIDLTTKVSKFEDYSAFMYNKDKPPQIKEIIYSLLNSPGFDNIILQLGVYIRRVFFGMVIELENGHNNNKWQQIQNFYSTDINFSRSLQVNQDTEFMNLLDLYEKVISRNPVQYARYELKNLQSLSSIDLTSVLSKGDLAF